MKNSRKLTQRKNLNTGSLSFDRHQARRWRTISNRQTPVATDTFKLLTSPAIGNLAR
jgi:hypothetical protein